MSLKDYECDNDKFEEDKYGPLCFPCAVCRWHAQDATEEPCIHCGHNPNCIEETPLYDPGCPICHGTGVGRSACFDPPEECECKRDFQPEN